VTGDARADADGPSLGTSRPGVGVAGGGLAGPLAQPATLMTRTATTIERQRPVTIIEPYARSGLADGPRDVARGLLP
jgi:hypothetical protein